MIQIKPINNAHLNFRFASKLSNFDGTGLISPSSPSTDVESPLIVANGTYCAPVDEEGNVAAGFFGCLPRIQSVS